ncbi:hypothetical protein GJ496_011744 [Pomphorhynchus laevis]|nr:hypothetical protein GJ496_011744 [Pomphorhynchus laevis]
MATNTITNNDDLEFETYMRIYKKYAPKYEKWSDLENTLSELVKSSRWSTISAIMKRIGREHFFNLITSFYPITSLSKEISFHFHIGDLFGAALILDAAATSHLDRYAILDLNFLKHLNVMIGLCFEKFSPFKLRDYAKTNLNASEDQFSKALKPTISKFIKRYNPLPRVVFICQRLKEERSTIFSGNNDEWMKFKNYHHQETKSYLLCRLSLLLEFPWQSAHAYHLAILASNNINSKPSISNGIIPVLSNYHNVISNKQLRKILVQIEKERKLMNGDAKSNLIKILDDDIKRDKNQTDYSIIPKICMMSGKQLPTPIPDYTKLLVCVQCQCYSEHYGTINNLICPVCMNTYPTE